MDKLDRVNSIKRPMEKTHHEYLKVLKECKGIVSMACAKFDIGRTTHYLWVDEVEGFKEGVEDANEYAIDHVESKLYNLIDANDTTATIFYLKTKAKKRGYVERQEMEMSGKMVVINGESDLED